MLPPLSIILERGISMTDFEQYKEHIEHTFNAYCKIVIRHTAINVARRRHKQQEREISLDYLTAEKHFPFVTLDNYFIEPERTKEYPCAIEGNTITLNSSLLAAALSRLPERKREMVYLRFFENYTYKEIGKRYGRHRCTASAHIRKALRQLQQEMEDYKMRTEK